MPIRGPLQETFSVDVLVDRLLKARVSPSDIIQYANCVLSSKSKLSTNYIEERLTKIASYQQQLGKLLRLPKVEQRSQEWHTMRKALVTASEFAQALGKAKFGTQKDFYKKKCGYAIIPFNPAEEPLKWGTMYEDVACSIYKNRYGFQIHDFGLLPHPSIKHFGASPDGINDFGIMVEIKCPFRRKITGEVPQQYYYQIQGQLSVCELFECDYVECELDEYGDLETWLDVGFEEKGIIIERKTDDPLNPWKYEYSQVFMPASTSEERQKLFDEASKFINSSVSHEEEVVLRFWTLRVFNCVRVYRDDDFINDKFTELEPIWDKITHYRNDYDKYKVDMMPTRGRAANAANAASLTHAVSAPSSGISGYAFLED